MKKIANKLASYVVHTGGISEQSFEVYQYGFQMGLEVMVCFVTSLGIAVYLHMIFEFAIFITIFILLRTYAGGLHIKSFLGCYLCSVATQTAALLFFKHYQLPLMYAWVMIIVCSGAILWISPAESIEREIDEGERNYYKKVIQKVIFFTVIFAFCCTVFHMARYVSLVSITMLIMLCSQYMSIIKFKIEVKIQGSNDNYL